MKTGMKLIQGALFVLLFLFAACTPHRRQIPRNDRRTQNFTGRTHNTGLSFVN